MTAVDHAPSRGADEAGILSRERTIAKPGFNRWLVPPAALAIHLCIGMSYGLSVFWKPLLNAVGITKPVACPDLGTAIFSTTCDWRQTDLVIAFTIGIVVLGVSAALFGGWLERAGPRKAGVVAACCWGGGFVISALGVYLHQLWVIWLGLGALGGIGLGLGYISPVSTLIKWFPDRRGLATGMAIMGFGGGAMIGSPLAALLINHFKSPQAVGVWQAMLVLGIVYFFYMLAGAFGYRVPPPGWRPNSVIPTESKKTGMITTSDVHLDDAHKTPQFWLIWSVLFLNVSAGIGLLSLAALMMQQIFGATLAVGAAFTGLISLFNSGGRFFWASLSDGIGRKLTYFCFFVIGMALYASIPTFAGWGNRALFVGAVCIIITMYGGGFATVPAYLADIFGTQFVGAIHGRLLTAWSAAGVVGPLLLSILHDTKGPSVKEAQSYNKAFYIYVAFLLVGFICNALIRPVAEKWKMSREQVAALEAHTDVAKAKVEVGEHGIGVGTLDAQAALAWAAVGIPFLWGVWKTLLGALKLF